MNTFWKKTALLLAALLLVGMFVNGEQTARQFASFASAAIYREEMNVSPKSAERTKQSEKHTTLTASLTPARMTALPAQRQQTSKDSVQSMAVIRVKAGSTARLRLALFLIMLVYILQLFANAGRVTAPRKRPSYFWKRIIHYIHALDGEKENTAYFMNFAVN